VHLPIDLAQTPVQPHHLNMAHLATIPNQVLPRVLAADSTSMATQLLVDALGRDGQFEMIESPSNAPAILALVKNEKPQIALISAQLGEPRLRGFDLVREIRAHSPGTRVIVLLDSSERTSVTEAFRAGAQGVFCRTESFRLLAKCIQCVANGEVWAGTSELQFVLAALAQPPLTRFLNLSGGVLSARETDVVRGVADGLTNREIAQRMKVTEHTVKNYLFRVFDKLGVSSRVEIVLYAFRNGNTPHNISSRRLSRSTAASSRVAARAAANDPGTIRNTAT
jgi:two-component system nitrate/nitrite response regulator NarL